MAKEQNFEKQSTCPKCGDIFTCSTATGSCWCMKIKLSDTARKLLKERYSTCLCPRCLAEYAEKVDEASCSI